MELFIPPETEEAASNTPEIGFAINPASPLPNPLNKPKAPPFLAPSKGFEKTPVIPFETPEKIDVTP